MTTQHLPRTLSSFLLSALLASLASCSGSSLPATPAENGGSGGGTGGASGGSGGGSSDASATAPIDSGLAPLQGVLIDDFEDGDDKASFPGAAWYLYDDSSNGGKSTIAFTGAPAGKIAMNGKGYESQRALEVSCAFDQGALTYQPYLGFGVWFADQAAPFDASAYVGVAYTYRGAAHALRVETFDVTDYDFLGTKVAASADWTTIVIPFSQLAQEGWGKHVAFNPKNVGNVSFQVRGNTGDKVTLAMDNLMFLSKLPNQDPDMTVMPAAPPAGTVIASIAIANPLQAQAMAQLNRGYNITNWLEQSRFTGTFTYDETFVSQLAAAGFKALRLPVDLDLYATTIGTGDTLDVTVSDDLFTVLDAFAAWTAKAGISLTIDYHQYDTSLDKTKPDTLTEAVLLWGKVAAHFAANPRADLYYELLNEPELSFGGTPPTQAEWTALAERMIAAIRASDKTHTLIFGDTQWYGIATLAARKPLSDSNVVYAIHDYEPFIFTHQGADWASMASTHDLPYPYASERWSAYFGDLGFTTAMPSWILDAARNYYRTGNRAAIRNQIVTAKKWAVDNNVPVICNEFGAYDRTSRLEDRARYLADVVSIFEELQIPWQQWFMIMDKSGAVAPEYSTAMHLGQ
jgi:endoglucanase